MNSFILLRFCGSDSVPFQPPSREWFSLAEIYNNLIRFQCTNFDNYYLAVLLLLPLVKKSCGLFACSC